MNPSASSRVAGGTSRPRVRWSLLAMCILYAVVVLVAATEPALSFPVIAMSMIVFNMLGLAFAVRAATRPSLPSAARRAWWLLSTGLLMLNLVPFVLGLTGTTRVEDPSAGMSAAPTYGDLIRLLAVAPLLGALMTFPRSDTTRRDGYKMLLDVITVVGGSFMLMWYFVLGPALTSNLPALTMIAATAYPIGDLALIFGATVVVLRGSHATIRRPMRILVGGLGMLVVADTYLGHSKLNPGEAHHPALQLGVLMTGLFLIAVAARQQCLLADGNQPLERRRRANPVSHLPYAALAAGSVLLIVESLRSGLYPWFGLITGAVVMSTAVAVRQILAMRENHDLITSDSLTGLANRVRLHDGLERAVGRANDLGERTAVMLIDMDGFKQVNDTLGHEAGDQLLCAFARLLRASVLGGDIVARLGGDEFAVVLHNVGTTHNAGTVAARIVAGMSEPVTIGGELVCPAASIGIAVTEPGSTVLPAALLHRADMAMYRAKAVNGSAYAFSDENLVTTITGK